MTIKFHPNVGKLFIGRGILGGGLTADSAITVYDGVQPTAQQILDNWASYSSNSANCLAHYVAANWIQPVNNTAPYACISKFPVAAPAFHSGIGKWAILWSTNPSLGAMALATIPTNSFIVVPVSNMQGHGVIRFDTDTNFTSGVSKDIIDGVITGSSN